MYYVCVYVLCMYELLHVQDKHSTFPVFQSSETESNCVAQAGLELRILPLFFQRADYKMSASSLSLFLSM